jgi:murein DD-endopeptidase MepM/ murein hydrolase activator NlpD
VGSNKKGDLSVWLDGQPLISNYRLSMREHEHPFIIPSKTINNGKHIIKIELVDASFAKNKVLIERSFLVDNIPLQAAFVRSEADYKVFQGRTLHLQFQANKEVKEAKVRALSNVFDCFPESKNSSIYECFVPISCEEAPNEYLLNVEIMDKVGNALNLESKFQVVLFPFKKQTLQVSDEKMTEEKTLGADSAKLEMVMEELLRKSPHDKLWRGPFCTPIDVARVTCDFGTIRTTQEKGRYAHKGLDIANAPRSVVWAPQDGIVVHKERYAFSGNTVIIDHGWGIFSLFFHLDNFADINVGQKLAKGNPVGTLGKTGYATGYHLHWEMRVNNVQVDPMQWTKISF